VTPNVARPTASRAYLGLVALKIGRRGVEEQQVDLKVQEVSGLEVHLLREVVLDLQQPVHRPVARVLIHLVQPVDPRALTQPLARGELGERLERPVGDHREQNPLRARYLADRIRDNIRSLEGCLNRIVAYARLTRAPITVETAAKALAALTPTIASPSDPQGILEACSSYFNVPIQAITGKSRAKQIAEARHVAMYLLREDAELALKQIGLLLGHRDHSTVIHGVQKIAHLLINDPRLSAQMSEIRAQITH